MKKTRFVTFLSILFISFACTIYAANTDIRFNSLGFLPNNDKRASIAAACTSFSVKRASDNSVAFSGTVTGPVSNPDSGESIYTANFSALTETGLFYLDVTGVGTSPNFQIAPDVYNNAYYMAMKGFYLWRCGTAVTYLYPRDTNTYAHAICHENDAYDNYIGGTGSIIASTKGWHDAGDYNKYTVNAGVTIGMLFIAWEQFKNRIQDISLDVPNTAAGYPDFLKELKWETDWLLTMQKTDGSAYDKVSEVDFDGFELPEYDTGARYFWGYNNVGTVEAANFCAVMAMAARNFQPYDPTYSATCLSAATLAYNYLTSHLTNTYANISGCYTGDYSISDPDQARLWAAAEMWETTGSASALSDFESRAAGYSYGYVDSDFDWAGEKNLGMFTYVLSSRAGRNSTLLAAIRSSILSTAGAMIATRNNHGYGRPLGTFYYWGCNGSVARQVMMLQIANTLSPGVGYVNTALDAIGYLYGRNMHDRSYVTGVGINPPMNPHDRRSIGDSVLNPWPGYLVGGSPGTNDPGQTGSDPVVDAMSSGLPPAQYWVDNNMAWSANEICINWQGALVYALAGFAAVPTPTPTPAPVPTPGPDLAISDIVSYPNPCIAGVNDMKISANISRPADDVKVEIYTFGTRKIRVINEGALPAGNITLTIPKSIFKDLATGMYFYILSARDEHGKTVVSKIQVIWVSK